MAGAVYQTNPDGSRTLVSNGSYFNPNGNRDFYQADVATSLDDDGNPPAGAKGNTCHQRGSAVLL